MIAFSLGLLRSARGNKVLHGHHRTFGPLGTTAAVRDAIPGMKTSLSKGRDAREKP